MPYRRKRYTPRRRPAVGRKTRRIRKLAGQKPVTWAETISRYAGPVGRLAGAVSSIAGLVNAEAKYVDTVVSGTGITNSGSYSQYLTSVAEGDDISQRNGRTILSKNLTVKLRIKGDSTQAGGTVFGYAIIMDKKADVTLGATPWTDVFSTTDPQSAMNKSQSERFIILKRGLMTVVPGGKQIAYNAFNVNLKGIHLKYNGTTSTSYDTNQIFMVAVSDQGTLVPLLYAQIRYNYYDN